MYKPLGRFLQNTLDSTADVVNFIKNPGEYTDRLLEWLMPEHYDAVATVGVLVGAWHELGKPELDTMDSHDGTLHLATFANAIIDVFFLNLKDNFNRVSRDYFSGYRIVQDNSMVGDGCVFTYLGDGLYLRSFYYGGLELEYFRTDYRNDDKLMSLDMANDNFVANGSYNMWQLPWQTHVDAIVPQDGESCLVFEVEEYLILTPVDPKTHEPKEW